MPSSSTHCHRPGLSLNHLCLHHYNLQSRQSPLLCLLTSKVRVTVSQPKSAQVIPLPQSSCAFHLTWSQGRSPPNGLHTAVHHLATGPTRPLLSHCPLRSSAADLQFRCSPKAPSTCQRQGLPTCCPAVCNPFPPWPSLLFLSHLCPNVTLVSETYSDTLQRNYMLPLPEQHPYSPSHLIPPLPMTI